MGVGIFILAFFVSSVSRTLFAAPAQGWVIVLVAAAGGYIFAIIRQSIIYHRNRSMIRDLIQIRSEQHGADKPEKRSESIDLPD